MQPRERQWWKLMSQLALGIHGEHAPGKHPAMNSQDEIFSRYLKHHLLPQIYFDLWPIALGTLFICVMERGLLESDANRSWVDVFTVLFEATSAYTTVGFSYGNVSVGLSLGETAADPAQLQLLEPDSEFPSD